MCGRNGEYISGECPVLPCLPRLALPAQLQRMNRASHLARMGGAGEDGALGAPLSSAYVRGVQSMGVAAVVKHWILNSQVCMWHVHVTCDMCMWHVHVKHWILNSQVSALTTAHILYPRLQLSLS